MESSLFQFYFLDLRSTGAADGIDGKFFFFEKILCGTVVAYRGVVYFMCLL